MFCSGFTGTTRVSASKRVLHTCTLNAGLLLYIIGLQMAANANDLPLSQPAAVSGYCEIDPDIGDLTAVADPDSDALLFGWRLIEWR